jgi:hypothetical protein
MKVADITNKIMSKYKFKIGDKVRSITTEWWSSGNKKTAELPSTNYEWNQNDGLHKIFEGEIVNRCIGSGTGGPVYRIKINEESFSCLSEKYLKLVSRAKSSRHKYKIGERVENTDPSVWCNGDPIKADLKSTYDDWNRNDGLGKRFSGTIVNRSVSPTNHLAVYMIKIDPMHGGGYSCHSEPRLKRLPSGTQITQWPATMKKSSIVMPSSMKISHRKLGIV